MTPILREKRVLVYLEVKSAALLAIAGGIDAYDFRKVCSLAMAQAALELEQGNISAAARRLGMSRNQFVRRTKLTTEVPTKCAIALKTENVDNSPQ